MEQVDSRRMLGDVPGLPYMSLEDECLCMVSVACELWLRTGKIHKAVGGVSTLNLFLFLANLLQGAMR